MNIEQFLSFINMELTDAQRLFKEEQHSNSGWSVTMSVQIGHPAPVNLNHKPEAKKEEPVQPPPEVFAVEGKRVVHWRDE